MACNHDLMKVCKAWVGMAFGVLYLFDWVTLVLSSLWLLDRHNPIQDNEATHLIYVVYVVM